MICPIISVIVPVYRVEPYLKRCVDSILKQTFKDFELILVDDGSPDNCPSICDEYAKKDSRVTVIHKKNEGVSKARNDGVAQSNGAYITFIDSDDWIYLNYLGVLYTNLIKYNADISVMRIERVGENNLSYANISVFTNREALNCFGLKDDERFRAPMAKLVARDIIMNNEFPIDRKFAEDMAVVYKWYYCARKVVGTEQRLYFYNQNENSITKQKYGLFYLGNLKTLKEMLLFFEKNNFKELYENKVLEYVTQLEWQYHNLICIDQKEIATKLKKELKHFLKKESLISIDRCPHCYELAFPIKTQLYWWKCVLKNKMRRK